MARGAAGGKVLSATGRKSRSRARLGRTLRAHISPQHPAGLAGLYLTLTKQAQKQGVKAGEDG